MSANRLAGVERPRRIAVHGAVARLLLWVAVSAIAVAAQEGQTYVDDIEFVGNETFERDKLLRVMELRPKGLFRKTSFTDLKLRLDMQGLELFYANQGFIDAAVEAEVVRELEDDEWVDLVFTVEEGRRVRVSSVTITPNPVVDESTATFIETGVGDSLVRGQLRDDARAIADTLGAAGFLEAKVEPAVEIDSSRYTAAVRFVVREGPRVIAGPIRIEGAATINQTVVRRELAFEQGDTLSEAAIRKSERRLYRTRLFRFVTVEPSLPDTFGGPVPADTVVPVIVSLDPTDFWSLETGIGYSFIERVRAVLEVSYANLFRRGHRITLDSEASSVKQRAEVIYSTPWLFVIPLQTEVSGFYRRHDTLLFDVPLGFSGEFAGFSAAVGQVTDFGLSYRVGFTYENVLRLAVASPETLPEDVPEKNTASIGIDLSFDRRNDIFNPTRGYIARLSSEFAGVFGSATNQFVKTTGMISGYYGIGDILHCASGLQLGWVGSYGASAVVPPQELFFAGGPRSVRGYGFEQLVIGPGGDPVGGNVELVAHVIDFRFPLFWWFWGAAFLDAGFVWDDLESVEFGDIKYGAGPSLRLLTPIAMVRFDVGFKLDPREDEDLVEFYLDIGQAF